MKVRINFKRMEKTNNKEENKVKIKKKFQVKTILLYEFFEMNNSLRKEEMR